MTKKLILFPEKQIEGCCKDWLNLNNWIWWKMPIGPVLRGGKADGKIWCKNLLAGFPDICGVLKPPKGIKPLPIFWACEFKTTKGKLSLNQKIWHEKLREGGVEPFVAHSLHEMIIKLNSLREKYYEMANRLSKM